MLLRTASCALLLLASVASAGTQPAPLSDPEPAVTAEGALLNGQAGRAARLLAELRDWLEAEEQVPPFDDLPRLRQVGAGGFGRILAPFADGEVPADLGNEVEALYSDATATIILPAGWRPDLVRDRSVLLHELVHHAQNRAGRRFSCPEEREQLAYEVQGRFLEAAGTSLEAEFGIDPMTLFVRTRCLW